jgi:phosphopantetheinyl transferase
VIRVALLEGETPSLLPGAGDNQLLHPRELEALSPKAVPKRRDDFLRGRLAARRLLAAWLSVDPVRLAVLPDTDGVPWAEEDGRKRLPVSLSISHTAGVAAAAFVDLPWRVGIDVEHPIDSASKLVGDYFEACEMELCGGLDTTALSWRAAEIWALKEAGLKALGTGLRVPTSAVVVKTIATQTDAAGWQSVDMVLGNTAPDPGRAMKAWVRRHGSVAVALSLLVPENGGEPPNPDSPIRIVGAGQ